MRLRAGAERRAAPARAPAAGQPVSRARRWPKRCASRSAALSRSTNCATNIPDELVPPGDTPTALSAPGNLHRRAPALSGTASRHKVQEQIEHELELIADLRYEPYFLTVYDIVRFARSRAHPVPGPRLGRQLGRLLLPGRHRSRSGARQHAVRAFHLARSATSRPTSTSTSSTSGAKKSSSTSIDKYGRDRAALAAAVITLSATERAARHRARRSGVDLQIVDQVAKRITGSTASARPAATLRRVRARPGDAAHRSSGPRSPRSCWAFRATCRSTRAAS